ncbi:Oidioi.mRNA.OKI2018_I69.chr2.g4818.t1.cds [Oikopleura dioica]|uniref:Oidioi.mRNA.OKI2018_I69.chr2.g4818.t1.cds n=1 Tax=Oikopleura dioica TaxID=34765 RepID=A0ABN7T543_OIKDI|nr:Oidioi.mRNA.OKI2018_I69.chr2.g4818.t1.cds [Oikopleura dioica]
MKFSFTVLALVNGQQTTDLPTTTTLVSTTQESTTSTEFESTTSTEYSTTTSTTTATTTTTATSTTTLPTTTTTTIEPPVMTGSEARTEISNFAAEMADLLAQGRRTDRFFSRRYSKLDRIFTTNDDSLSCAEPYDPIKYGGSDFTDFVKSASNSSDLCSQATLVEDAAKLWTANYGCKDGVTKRALKRWPQWLEKINKKYC